MPQKKSAKKSDAMTGNTGSTDPLHRIEGMYICFTLSKEASGLNNGQLFNILKALNDIERFIFQLEQGESGYIHYQGAIWFKKKKKGIWIKKRTHNCIRLSLMDNELASIAYCSKGPTKIEGPFKYNMPEIYMGEDLPGENELYDWQKDIINIIKEPPKPRIIHWIYSNNGNMGKSTFCKYLIFHYQAQEVGGKKSDIAYAINTDSNIFVFDLSRTVEDYVSYDAIECLKNGKIFSNKYESNMKIINIPHVIIFSNFAPDKSKMSIDRWNVKCLDTARVKDIDL